VTDTESGGSQLCDVAPPPRMPPRWCAHALALTDWHLTARKSRTHRRPCQVRQKGKDRLKKAGAQIEAVRGTDQRYRQSDARKDGNHLEYLDVKFSLGKCVRKNLRDNSHLISKNLSSSRGGDRAPLFQTRFVRLKKQFLRSSGGGVGSSDTPLVFVQPRCGIAQKAISRVSGARWMAFPLRTARERISAPANPGVTRRCWRPPYAAHGPAPPWRDASM
jgi:hypothetical protein